MHGRRPVQRRVVGYGQDYPGLSCLSDAVRIAYEANLQPWPVATDSPYSGGAGGARRYHYRQPHRGRSVKSERTWTLPSVAFYFISNGPRELLDGVANAGFSRPASWKTGALRGELLLNSDLLMLGQYKPGGARLRASCWGRRCVGTSRKW